MSYHGTGFLRKLCFPSISDGRVFLVFFNWKFSDNLKELDNKHLYTCLDSSNANILPASLCLLSLYSLFSSPSPSPLTLFSIPSPILPLYSVADAITPHASSHLRIFIFVEQGRSPTLCHSLKYNQRQDLQVMEFLQVPSGKRLMNYTRNVVYKPATNCYRSTARHMLKFTSGNFYHNLTE